MIVLVRQDKTGADVVYVAPITHSPPSYDGEKLGIPAVLKSRLGLDNDNSWISAAELNVFIWPGHDLRPIRRPVQDTPAGAPFFYGFLPVRLFAISSRPSNSTGKPDGSVRSNGSHLRWSRYESA